MCNEKLIVPILAIAILAACDDAGPTEVASTAGDVVVGTKAPARGPNGVVQTTSIVTDFPNGAAIPGATARLMRGKDGVNAWLQTNGLIPGNAYTLWVVVFNHPANCDVPGECRLIDAIEDDPAVGVDLLNAVGHVVGGSGEATFAGRVAVGQVGIRGVGLLDAFEPEIHLVVRDHGPKLPGAAQLGEFGGGCETNGCANVQDALHF